MVPLVRLGDGFIRKFHRALTMTPGRLGKAKIASQTNAAITIPIRSHIMPFSFRNSFIAASAVFGLSGFAAIAAPPAAGNPAPGAPATTATAIPSAGPEMATTIEQRIRDLHAKLLITPAQQPQWEGFAQVMRDNGRNMEQTFHQRVNTMSNLTAPENMRSYAQVAMNHAQDMQKLVPAFQTLYDTMSDSQKKTADQVFRDDAHRGRPMKHG